MKRFLSAFLAILLIAGIFPVIPVSATAENPELYSYEVIDGKAIVTKADVSISGDIAIPAELEGYPVTGIGSNAFSDCDLLTGVIIPEGVTNIGLGAFSYCDLLERVTIANSVIIIDEGAFYGCSSLTDVAIGNGVTDIGLGAFYDCVSLSSVTIPNSVISIGDYVFKGCSSLTAVSIGNSVTRIGDYAFYGCSSLTGVTLPDSVTSTGIGVFYECVSLTDVSISNSLTGINNYTFAKCTSLESIVIPKGVTTLGDYAFSWCAALESIVIPDSVTGIGKFAFANCSGLTHASIGNGVTILGEAVFYQCTGLNEVIIGESLNHIGNHAFYNCSSLTQITVPDSIISIGIHAFSGCSSLKTVCYCGNETQWKAVYISSYNECLTDSEIIFNYKPLVNGKVEFWRLILQDHIGVNFQMKYTDSIKTDENAYVEVAVAGEISKVPVGSAIESLLVDVAAAQMTDEITICVVSGDGIRGEVSTYSVKAYADQILEGNYDAETKNLIRCMLSYGAKAQNLFGYRQDAMADSGVDCLLSAVPNAADMPMDVSGEVEGICLYGVSLLYDSKLALRYYFETEDISGYTFTMNGKQLQPVEKSGRYYVEIPDILPQNIDKFFTLAVQDSQGNIHSILYNPLNYVVRMYNNANTAQDTKNLLQALYTYHLATKAYVA